MCHSNCKENAVNDGQPDVQKVATKVVDLEVTTLSPAQKSLHNNFLVSAKTLKKSLVRTIYYLAMINNQKIHRILGFASINDYAWTTAGFTPKQTRNFLNLAKNLPQFKEVERAVEAGAITWAKAQEICKATDPQEQQRWLDVAAKTSLKDLREKLVVSPIANSPAQPGLTEPQMTERIEVTRAACQSPKVAPEVHHLTLRLTSEQAARWATCLEKLMKTTSDSREELILAGLGSLLAQGHGPHQGAGAPYLIVMLECPTCGRTMIPTNRGEANADPALLRAAKCDAIIEDETGGRRGTIPPRMRRLALQNARYRCQANGCQNTSFLEIHHRTPAALGGANTPENLIVLCSRCHRRLHEADLQAQAAVKHAPT